MPNDRLRRQIAFEAARLMYSREESEYFRAKQKAGKRLGGGWIKPSDLPSNAEIRDQVQQFARLHEGDQRKQNLRDMRVEALRLMRLLRTFRPRLIGSVLTGHVRQGSDIDLHLFSDGIDAVTGALEAEALTFDVERKRVRKHDEERVFTHVHVQERFKFELTIYAANQAHYIFKSSITGRAIERASIGELEDFLQREYPGICLDEQTIEAESKIDPFQIYEMLLLPLENVKQNPKWHPEGDALYHTLQVFDLARDELPYDEEFLLAALLHDVGKAIDTHDHVTAGLDALAGYITQRTHWLIEHHMLAHAACDGSLGHKQRLRLQANENFDELLLLSKCDRAGRCCGVETSTLDEAIEYLRELAETNGG